MLILGTLLLSNITITLPSEVSVMGSEITLGQIATITGADEAQIARVKEVELGYAPSPGFTRVFHGWKIEDQIARQFTNHSFVIDGEATCRVRPTVAVITGEELRLQAKEALKAVFEGEDVEIRSAKPLADLTVPKGIKSRELIARPILSVSNTNRPMPGVWNVPIHIVIDNMPYRTVWASYDVQVFREMPVLLRDIAQHQQIGAGDLGMQRTAVRAGVNTKPLRGTELLGATAKRPLRRGDPVTVADVVRQPAVSKGEAVNLTIENGLIIVKTHAVALEDGFVNDSIQVQVQGTLKVLSAKVLHRGHLQLALGSKIQSEILQSK